MKPRSNIEYTQIHVSIPVRLKREFDETLSYNQSRSKMISKLIYNYLEQDTIDPTLMTNRQIIALLLSRVKHGTPEYLVIKSLLEILS